MSFGRIARFWSSRPAWIARTSDVEDLRALRPGSTGPSLGFCGRTIRTSVPALGDSGPARDRISTTLVSPASG